MFIAHLPAAYLAFKAAPRLPRSLWLAGMLGSVAPDLDLLYFYFVDHRAHHHHDYITHRPFFWASLILLGFGVSRYGHAFTGRFIRWFSAGAMIHMALDTIAGRIGWLWPFSDAAAPLVVIQATHSNWILSFLNHWTFKIEIAIVVVAFSVFLQARRRARRQN